jgi:hypothetical protein
VASNEFGSYGGFAHIGGSLREERTERMTDMLPDGVKLIKQAGDYRVVSRNPLVTSADRGSDIQSL